MSRGSYLRLRERRKKKGRKEGNERDSQSLSKFPFWKLRKGGEGSKREFRRRLPRKGGEEKERTTEKQEDRKTGRQTEKKRQEKGRMQEERRFPSSFYGCSRTKGDAFRLLERNKKIVVVFTL